MNHTQPTRKNSIVNVDQTASNPTQHNILPPSDGSLDEVLPLPQELLDFNADPSSMFDALQQIELDRETSPPLTQHPHTSLASNVYPPHFADFGDKPCPLYSQLAQEYLPLNLSTSQSVPHLLQKAQDDTVDEFVVIFREGV